MGLFDKLLSRSSESKPENELAIQPTNHEVSPSIISRAIAERECGLSKALRIPYTEAALAGGSLMQLAPTLKALVTGNQIGNGSLVRVVFPAGVKGNLAIDKGGMALGGILKDGGGFAQARLAAVDPATLAAQAAMAAIMMEINKKLDSIQETQQRILGYLEQDKQAEQQANLNILSDILESYKHNWDNPQFLQNHHMKVLDIKQTAEKNIIFYQEQLAAAINKMPAIHLDQAVSVAITDLGKLFSQYRMALYLFSFSSFLEVMLLGNFRQAYLDQVAAKVQEYNLHYQIQFSECRDMIKKYSSESVETKVMAGIGNAGKALGKFIGSVPFLAQGPVDEWLQDNSEALLKGNDEKTQKVAALFSAEEQIGSEAFVDSIRNVAVISNQATDVLFDGEALYLAVA
ncbi:MAG: hypothetical protein IJ719_18030 [Clostridia bacterium]|nr:hypothetical protein [Clostridia bacterium]